MAKYLMPQARNANTDTVVNCTLMEAMFIPLEDRVRAEMIAQVWAARMTEEHGGTWLPAVDIYVTKDKHGVPRLQDR